MQLRKYTPDPKWTTRCNGKYQIVANDPALLLSDGVDYTNLIQVAIKSTERTDTFIEELRTFGEIFAPEHRFQLGEICQVMPNLTEQPLQADGDNKGGENEPWESAHAQVGFNIQEEVIGLKQAIETLTKALTAKESLTAPLTTVTATSNGEVSPVSSISIAELTVAIHDAFEKAYNEGGFLYKATEEDNKRLADCIVEMLRDSINTTTPIMQETVRESVEEGSIHIQQKVMESIQDTSSGLLRMITNPSKEHAGEIALITKSHLAPYFETLAKAVSRLAVLLEVATNSPEHAALGNAQLGITPTYTLLMDIKQLLRTIQYQISSGQKALNRAVMDIETSLAQEIRINNENEAMARDYTRRLMKMKHTTLQRIKNQSGVTNNQAMVDLIEQGLDLQIKFQDNGSLTNPDEWRIRESMNNSEYESQNQEPDDVIEEEKEPSIAKRKSPEIQPVMEAHCKSVAEIQEELEALEEAEVEMAIKMSMQDLEIQPLDDLQSQIAEEAHDTKPAALSNEELAKMKKHEEDHLAQEQVRRQEEQEQIERDVAELIPENTSILNKNEKGTVSAQEENTNSPAAKVQESKGDHAYKEEVVPGTPLMKMNPNVVTPKDLKTKLQTTSSTTP
ncbi:hypothetical protein ACHAWO_003821 [Cyclotella atomus]|uniref:Uncharacterized protein n=1 Tax=Cyclotella atomus TaxID=382360 RepID=A0ABD3QAE7_9STRA